MAISLKHNFTSAVADELDTSLVRPSNWNAEHDLTLATARLIGRTTAGTGVAEEISVGTGLSLTSGSLSVSSTTPQVNSINTFTVAQVIQTTDNTNPALRITQLGTADALRVEDETSPDATPFVITANGHAIAGYGSTLTIETVVPQFQSHTDVLAEGGFGGVDWGNTATGQVNWFGKSRGGSYGTQGIVQSGDVIGDFRFYGSDGVGLIPAAKIEVEIDGTPGVNDMPGRISFFTTADGSATPTERMRINNAGNVGIGVTNPQAPLQILGSTQNRMWLSGAAINSRQLFVRSNGTFVSPTIVASGDAIGSVNFFGYDGAANIELANMTATVDSTPGTNDMPGRLTFSTTADGAASPTERLRIDSSGNVGIGTNSPGAKLDVSGSGTQLIRSRTTDTSGSTFGIVSAQYTGGGGGVASRLDMRATDGNTQLVATTNSPLLILTNSLERFRIGESGQFGIGGATYGTSGQAFISGGASAAPSWGTLGIAGGGTGQTTASSAANALDGYLGITSAGGTTTLTNTSARTIVVTGTSAQTIVLPDVTTLALGWSFIISNTTNNIVTVQSSGGNSFANTLTAGLSARLVCVAITGTTTGSWAFTFIGSTGRTGTGSLVYNGTPTITTPLIAQVSGGSAASSTLTLQSTTGAGTTDSIIFRTASQSERFRIDTSGALGIGGANYGTSGQVLTSAGAGAAPTWETPAAGGGVSRGQIEQQRLGAFT